jgi:hypothetical protein
MTGVEVVELVLLIAAGLIGLMVTFRNRWTDVAWLGTSVVLLALVAIFWLLKVG